MSGAQYEPGTVAVATVRGVPNVRVLRTEGTTPWWSALRVGGTRLHDDEAVTDVRPLVVLDPDDAEQARHFGYAIADRLTEFWAEEILDVADRKIMGEVVQAVLLAQTAPPKPAEPTGLGAVVKDRDGHKWVAIGGGWFIRSHDSGSSEERRYADIDAVDLMWQGVTP